MTGRERLQELVVLFDAQGSKVDQEMRMGQFNGLLAQKGTLQGRAGTVVKAGYAQIGAGLTVRAAVFFQFKVDEQGYVDATFNLPLAYMAQNAGAGPDLGNGPIQMASRSQCPVPWHAINLWEPDGGAAQHAAMTLQKAVWRNRLGLKPLPRLRQEAGRSRQGAGAVSNGVVNAVLRVDEAVKGQRTAERIEAMEEKLTTAFGEAGRVSVGQYARQPREQVGQVTAQFRSEIERQQKSYLEQIRNCRDEIQKLKAALRHEQERNRRLQNLLRGDV